MDAATGPIHCSDMPNANDTNSPDTLARLRGLLEVSRLVRSDADLPTMLAEIARILKETIGYGVVVVNLYRPAWDDFWVAAVEGGTDVKEALLGATYKASAWNDILDPRFERRGAFFIAAGALDFAGFGTRYIPPDPGEDDPEAWHPEDELFIPVRHSDGRVLGVLSLGAPVSGRRPSDEELDVLVAVAGHAAFTVQSAQEASEAAQYQRALEQLLHVSSRLADKSLPLNDHLQTVCEGIRSALGFQRVVVEGIESGSGHVEPRATVGWASVDRMSQNGYRLGDVRPLFDPSFSVSGCYLVPTDAVTARMPRHLVADVTQNKGSGPHAWGNHWLLVPLHDASRNVIGLIWAGDPGDGLRPSPPRAQALRTFANHAATAIESQDREAGPRVA
jgi:GAF domain-containing protein